jgi:hypothetical protein
MGGMVVIAALRSNTLLAQPFAEFRKPLLVSAVFAIYLVLFPVLGFALATALFLFALLRGVESRGLWQALVLSILITAGLHELFGKLLKASLPLGVLGWMS